MCSCKLQLPKCPSRAELQMMVWPEKGGLCSYEREPIHKQWRFPECIFMLKQNTRESTQYTTFVYARLNKKDKHSFKADCLHIPSRQTHLCPFREWEPEG